MKRKLPSLIAIVLTAFLALFAGNSFGQVIFTSKPDSIAVVNQLYNYAVVTTFAPNAPTYSLQKAPAGMTINASTGLVSWTPASMSDGTSVVIKAHNNNGDFFQTYNLYITDAVACDTNIISYWPLDAKIGTSVPEAVHGYDGLWQGAPGPEPVISTDGMIGSSVKFSPATNDDWGYNVADVNQYEFKGTVQFSVSFWFKNLPNTITPMHEEAFIGRWCGAASGNAGWYIRWNPFNEKVEFYMQDHGPTDTLLINPTTIAADDQNWHHVVATFYNGTDLAQKAFMHLFVDGVSSTALFDFWTDDFDGAGDLNLGYYYWAVEPFSGLLDEVAVWKKELIQSDVNVLRNKGLLHQPMCSEGNTAPLISSTAITTATQDVAYSYQLTYREIDGDPITKSAPVLPTWLTFNTTTGMLSGTPTNDNVGNNNVTLRVSDGTVNVDQSFVIAVANVNDPPVITSTAVTAVNEDVAYTYTIVANDIDAGSTLTYSAPVLPSWLSFNATTHVLSGTPTNAQVGHAASAVFDVTLRVTDNAGAATDQSFTITVNQVNDPPVINSQNSLSVNEDQSLTIGFSALNVTDVDNTYPDDFTLTVKDGSNYTHVGNTITPAANWNGTLTVPIDLSDGSATVSFDLSVTVNAVNDAPSFTSAPIDSVVVGQQYQYWIYTEDAEGSARTLTCITKPSWLEFSSNSGNGLLQGTPAKADTGTTEITLRVTDGSLNTDQVFNLKVIVDNYAPVITSTPALTVKVDSLYMYTVTATDRDNDNLTVSVPTLPSWLTFNSSTKVLSGIPGSSNVGNNSVVVEVTDGKEPVQQSFTISVSNPNAVTNLDSRISSVYPVPASDYVTFQFSEKLDRAELSIYNAAGGLIRKINVSNLDHYKLDVSVLAPDYYIYRIKTAKDIQTGSLVVE